MAIDGINPFLQYNSNLGINQQLGGQAGAQKVNPFKPITPVKPTEEAGRCAAYAGFNPTKWVDGASGLRQGALGEDGAVSGKLPGGKGTKLGVHLNYIDGAYKF